VAAAAATASAAVLAPAVAGAQSQPTHTVAPGDTLFSLARRFGTTVGELSRVNQLTNPNQIRVGQVLTLTPVSPVQAPAPAPAPAPAAPAAPRTYQVQPGDTLWRIAVNHGVAMGDLVALNGIANPDVLAAGQVLTLPGGAAAPARAPVPAPAPAPAPAPSAPSAGASYTVVAGDTLWSIAQRFGTTVDDLVARNGLADPSRLGVGQTLQVRAPVTVPRDLFGSRAGDPAVVALVPMFDRWADYYGVPRDLLKALAYLESGWNNAAVSSSGARGIGQLMPDTATWINAALLGGARLDPGVPEHNIQMSARYLRYLIEQSPNVETALAGYYQGLSAVRAHGPYPDTVRYVQLIQGLRHYFQ
jgi:LysM repeat protein